MDKQLNSDMAALEAAAAAQGMSVEEVLTKVVDLMTGEEELSLNEALARLTAG